jgi:cyclopropane fatty-acyl-phospholipid synthase-like methyltransferase
MSNQESGGGEPQYQPAFDLMQETGPQRLGIHASWAYYDDPKRLAFTLARYKFVAKMLEGMGHVLEVGCSDGFATRIVRQATSAVTAVDFDPRSIASARETVSPRWPVTFIHHDLMLGPVGGCFDAVYAMDTLEHIPESDEDRFLRNMIAPLKSDGVAIIGMPSLQSQTYASPHSRAGHVNCKDQRALKAVMQRYFGQVFMFGMNDETLHTGYHAMAHYIIALCCGRRNDYAGAR